MMANFRDNLRRLRLAKNLSQKQLAENVHMSPKHLQRIESKNNNAAKQCKGVQLKTIEKLARALEVDDLDLVLPSDPYERNKLIAELKTIPKAR